ncbi:MAG: glycosyltransferase family 4 protein [Mariniphaga sp.]|nr:glycosyltransferase family 4 protein [Mariniphaga sp.]
MKILYFHQHFSTPAGSTGTRSYEFGKALVKAGHNVTIICGSYWIADSGLSGPFINGKRTGCVDGINVVELELSYSNAQGFLKRAWLFIRYSISGIKVALSVEYDILFATSTPLTAGIPGVFGKIFRRKKFIFEVRDLWPELPREMGVITNPVVLKLMDWLETVTYKYADKCIALAPGIASGIKKKVPNKQVTIIPNGSDEVDPKQFSSNSNDQKLIAVFTGAHGIANGLDAILDAAGELLKRSENDIEIQFIGDGKLKPGLIARVENEKLHNCKFIAPMPKHEMFDYLRENADAGLMVLDNIPAFYNGTSPNKFFDYISLGLPVINNYPGWLAELIVERNCGIAIAPGDPIRLAEALVSLKQDKNLCKKYGQNARILSEEKFSRKLLSREFVEYITSC